MFGTFNEKCRNAVVGAIYQYETHHALLGMDSQPTRFFGGDQLTEHFGGKAQLVQVGAQELVVNTKGAELAYGWHIRGSG